MWYYQYQGQTIGPVDFATLQQAVNGRYIGPHDWVAPAGGQEWMPASQVEGLFAATPAASPPAPKEPTRPSQPPTSDAPPPAPVDPFADTQGDAPPAAADPFADLQGDAPPKPPPSDDPFADLADSTAAPKRASRSNRSGAASASAAAVDRQRAADSKRPPSVDDQIAEQQKKTKTILVAGIIGAVVLVLGAIIGIAYMGGSNAQPLAEGDDSATVVATLGSDGDATDREPADDDSTGVETADGEPADPEVGDALAGNGASNDDAMRDDDAEPARPDRRLRPTPPPAAVSANAPDVQRLPVTERLAQMPPMAKYIHDVGAGQMMYVNLQSLRLQPFSGVYESMEQLLGKGDLDTGFGNDAVAASVEVLQVWSLGGYVKVYRFADPESVSTITEGRRINRGSDGGRPWSEYRTDDGRTAFIGQLDEHTFCRTRSRDMLQRTLAIANEPMRPDVQLGPDSSPMEQFYQRVRGGTYSVYLYGHRGFAGASESFAGTPDWITFGLLIRLSPSVSSMQMVVDSTKQGNEEQVIDSVDRFIQNMVDRATALTRLKANYREWNASQVKAELESFAASGQPQMENDLMVLRMTGNSYVAMLVVASLLGG